ncbi:hypothetical protein KF728_09265 [Candidatus Obscuribacterales bacterium]|nr:hypothetical protein [Candidatus Obscuribacterales bacterium]
MRRRHNRRNRKGASIFLIAGAAFLLAGLIYLGFQYALLTGGSREVRNGVDAAVLNLSKRICDVKVNPSSYADCADTSGLVGVSNINRVWGKAYLISANVDEMTMEGISTGEAVGAAASAYDDAQAVNDELRASITNKHTLDVLFKHLGDKRGAPLLGAQGIKTSAETMYPNALVDRGAESNLSFNPGGLPRGANPPKLCFGEKNYLPGYQTFTANNRKFCFTPFRIGETPHLIADSNFSQNRSDSHPLGDFATPIPNAFQGTGTAFGSGTALAAAASAVVNPMQQYQMTIPHAFIRITFSAISKWTIDDKLIKTIPYTANSGKVTGIKDYKLKGGQRSLTGWANLGTELKKPTLMAVLTAVPGDKEAALQRLVQRGQEIDPSFSMGQLQNLLNKQKTDPTVNSYYLFPRYSSPDRTDPTLDMGSAADDLPGWLAKQATAEGAFKEVVKEAVHHDYDNTFVYIVGGSPDCPKWLEITGTWNWRPGTGATQCLGTLYVNRLTTVKFKPGTEGP